MSLPDKQIDFIIKHSKSDKDARDMVGIFYKQRIKKYIKDKKEPKDIRQIVKNAIARL